MGGLRGQSETLGFALILSFTLISVGAIAVFGGTSLQATQQNIGAQNAETAMSQFDARASMVALGDSDTQTVAMGAGQQGTYRVDPDAGWIRVVHENETAAEQEVYNGTLGALLYEGETTEIGYQGGGVFRHDAGSVMLSPPEFHYRGSTLTLPVIQIGGEGSVAGNPRARVSSTGPATGVFPTDEPGDELSTNPVESGIVTVTVQSQYYEAWGRYFETRTEGTVRTNETDQTASVELVAPATRGNFEMPLDGNTMTLQGIQDHQLEEFTLTLIDDQGDNADFNNLDWSIYAESGGQEFEIRVVSGDGPGDGQSSHTTIYYSPDGSQYQTWTTEAFVFEAENEETDEDFNGDDDYDDSRLVLNFTSTDNATYEERNVKSFSNAGLGAKDFTENATFEGHENVVEPQYYSAEDNESIEFVVNHYLALMGPTIDLEVADSNQNTVSEDISMGYLQYNETEGYYLTYMHISENPVNVTVD